MRALIRSLVASAALSCAPALAQQLPQKVWTLQSPLVPLGTNCQLTSISAVTTLAACPGGIPTGAVFAVVQVETNAARWRDDGAAPTSAIGQPLQVSTPIYFTVAPLSNVQLIPQSGSMTVDINFYGVR